MSVYSVHEKNRYHNVSNCHRLFLGKAWENKINNTEARDTVDKDIMTIGNVISIWSLYARTCSTTYTHIYELNELVMYRSNIKITKSIAIIQSAVCLSLLFSFGMFIFGLPFRMEWCVKPSLFKYTIWKREHEALSHKTISGSRETSTIFKWFLLLHAASHT